LRLVLAAAPLGRAPRLLMAIARNEQAWRFLRRAASQRARYYRGRGVL